MIQGNDLQICSKLKSINKEGHIIQINKSKWVFHLGKLAQKGEHDIRALSYRICGAYGSWGGV